MKQQKAVKWFQSQIINIVNGNCDLSVIEIFEKAKAMEKEQIQDAFNQSWHDRMNPYKTAEKYYNETYAK